MRVLRYLTGLLALVALLAPRAADAQTYTLAPVAKQQFFDSNGDPVPGGKLCTYLAGTTTAATTYLDTTGTQNTNPIMLNAAGRPTNGGNEVGIYLASGSTYKFVLMTAGTDNTCTTGTTVWTQDGVPSVPASSSSVDIPSAIAGEALTLNQCVYLSDGSGAKTAGRWYKCDSANTYSSTLPEVGIALATSTIGQTLLVRITGSVTGLTGLSVGAKYYVSSTAGGLTSTAPANRRELGEADSTTSLVLAGNPALQSALASGTAANNTFLRGDQTWASTWTVITTTATGTQNDFAPGLVGNTVIRCNNASLLTITGFGGGNYDGQHVKFVSIGAGQVDFPHQSVSSSTTNRTINFATTTTAATSLAPGVGTLEYVYDGTTARWRLVMHEQGAPLTATFAGGNFTGTGSMTWTVDSGDVTTLTYYLKGRRLFVDFYITTSTVGGVVNTALQISNAAWGGYIAAKSTLNADAYIDNGAAQAVGYGQIGAAATVIQLLKNLSANWTLSTNASGVFGQINFEVQ